MPRPSRLAKAIRFREYLESEYERTGELAVTVTVRIFDQVLEELKNKSYSGAFDNYAVSVVAKPLTIRSGVGDIRAVRYFVSINSPNPDFNLFDLLDAGRPSLPKRPPGMPYPLWAIREPNLMRARRTGDSFAQGISYSLSNQRGDPEGPREYTLGPIREVPALNLYERIFQLCRAELKKEGFDAWTVIRARRGDGRSD